MNSISGSTSLGCFTRYYFILSLSFYGSCGFPVKMHCELQLAVDFDDQIHFENVIFID